MPADPNSHRRARITSAKATMSSMGVASLSNPITKSGRVVFNAKKDTRHIRVQQFGSKKGSFSDKKASDELYNILNHEIAVHVSGGAHNQHRMNSYGGAISVLTSCNGWPYKLKDSSEPGKLFTPDADDKYEVTFAGIAATRALHDTKDMSRNEEDCVVQSGGLCTLFNGGDDSIDVNQWVYWDFPDPEKTSRTFAQPEGVPKDKKQFVPRPFTKAMKSDSKYFDYRNRIFGRALSRAKPGQSFDVLLGCYL